MPDIFAAPAPLQDCDGIIDPAVFPIPTLDHVEFKNQASALRKAGEALAQTGDDIVTSWGSLTECYSAPESDVLFSALDPVSADGADVESAMDRAATALDTFADTVQEIKGEWFTLKTTAESFRESVVNDPDWDKANHWGTTKSDNVDKSNELRDKAESLIARYESAQRTCANALNADLLGRTHFSSAFEAEMDTTLNNPFVYDSVNMYVDAPSAWGAGASADLFWHQDALHAVGDFGMGIVEGVGGMVGAHSAAGWFEQSWGDSLKEYHWDNVTAAASLVGMYDAESDSLTWTGGETARQAWKELAHAIVPWEEWDERPGYMIATGALNIGSLAVGAALTVTGVGAVAGVPLLAWRGMDILDAMGGSGQRGGADVDLPDLAELPHTGGNGPPVVHIDTTGMSPSQLAELKVVLEELALAQSGGGGTPGGDPGHPNGSEHGPTGGDLNRAEETLSPESSGRGNDSGPGAKNSGDNNPSDWRGEVGGARPNNRGSEPEPALVGGGGNNNTFTESRGDLTGPPPRANATDINAPGTGNRSGNEPAESRSENSSDRQTQSDDNQTVPPHTGDRGPDDGTSTTSNNSSNESTNGRGNTSEDSTSNSNQQPPGGGSNNGRGSSGNGGGDGGSPGDPSTGGTGDGSRPPGPKTLAEFKTHRWNGDQDAFFRDLENLINDPNNKDVLREYYQEKDGHRHSIHTRVGAEELPLPKITKDPNTGRWTPLASAIPPDFLGDNIKMAISDKNFLNDKLTAKEYYRREDLRLRFDQLQWLAEERRVSIDAAKDAENKLQKAESDHGKYEKRGNNHTDVVKAKKEYDRLNTEMSITSELLGEKSADLGARFAFDGGTLKDSKGNPVMREVVDSDGNKTLVEVKKPDLTDAVLLGPSPLAPANGNDQFDLIYRTKDGIVIVEAKSSKHTELGETTHYPRSGKPVKVMQGRKEYATEIANRMWHRGETALALEIFRGIKNETLRYALFKGNPDVARGADGNPIIESDRSTPIADGFFYRLFDIYNWRI